MATMATPDRNGYHDIGRLLITCADRPGIVAAVSRFLYEHGANIVHLNQHSTNPVGGAFFMRLEFQLPDLVDRVAELEQDFSVLAIDFGMEWQLACAEQVHRLALFVSRADHALLELLWRQRSGDIRAEIAMVISNHRTLEPTVASWGIPFHYVPVDPANKQEAERQQLALVEGQADTLVFARYMQVVSSDFIARFPRRIINIHHSFLPAFVGADPYMRAYERGVKLIGATAHYVTEDLDAGPIIEQDVQRVDHRHNADQLRRLGRYVERVVLARAVDWHTQDRVLVHGNKTVVLT
jgi:formyltetrahydrofolate deformylase